MCGAVATPSSLENLSHRFLRGTATGNAVVVEAFQQAIGKLALDRKEYHQ